MPDYLTKRSGAWHFIRRVPLDLTDLDPRGVVRQSTKVRITDDPRGAKAARVTERINRELEIYWRGLVDGEAAEAKARYDAARKQARRFGFDYRTAEDLASRDMGDIGRRLDRFLVDQEVKTVAGVDAVFGGEPEPSILVSHLLDQFRRIERTALLDLSPDQLRKWENPRKRAIANFVAVIGDKPVDEISRADAIDFRTWWADRIVDEGLQADSANKDIGHLNRMIRTLDRMLRLGLQPVFADLRFADAVNGQRAAFDADFVAKRILAEGALAGLNDEARRIVYVMAETGLRISEVGNLNGDTIVLDGPVPHVRVRPDGRRMKTPQSERDVPLVGVALAALNAQPAGFPRYRDHADVLSKVANKFMRNHDLLPTTAHTVYSLRHTFEDRLTAIEAPEKLIAALMGHKFSRPRYGAGPSLKQKQSWLRKIAMPSPTRV